MTIPGPKSAPPCWECLGSFAPSEEVVTCVTMEAGVIHGVHYPKGTKATFHQRCLQRAA